MDEFYYVFFIINETARVVFVGTSCAKDQLAILRKHLRGEVMETKEFFGPGEGQIVPYMHICERRHFTREDAKIDARYWRGYFFHQGYQVIGDDVVPDALMKSSRAKIIFGDIESAMLQEVLMEAGTQNLHSSTRGGVRKTTRQKICAHSMDTVLNIRTEGEIAQAFRELTVKRGVTQSQMLGALIDEYSGVTNFEVQNLLDDLEETQERREELNKEIYRCAANGYRHEMRLRIKISVLKAMVDEVTSKWSYRGAVSEGTVPLYTRRQAQRIFSERRNYSQPEEAGTRTIRIDCLVYGRGARNRKQALFVYGTTIDGGEKIRIRWYPRKEYVGCPVTLKVYRSSNLVWQVAYAEAQDGAVDMIGAIPLCPEWMMKSPNHSCEKQEPVIELSELLRWHQDHKGEGRMEDFLTEKFQKEKGVRDQEKRQASIAYVNDPTEQGQVGAVLLDEEKELSDFERLIQNAQDRARKS